MFIDYDLETYPLQIKTDSVVGSNVQIAVLLYTVDNTYISTIQLYFSNTIEYHISDCSSWTTLTNVPEEQNKVWTLTKTTTSLTIHCNDVEVLNYVFSVSSDSDCVSKYSQDVEKIWFHSSDTASDWYRKKPTGMFII